MPGGNKFLKEADELVRLGFKFKPSVPIETEKIDSNPEKYHIDVDNHFSDAFLKILSSIRPEFENELAFYWNSVIKHIFDDDLSESDKKKILGLLKSWYIDVYNYGVDLYKTDSKELTDLCDNLLKSRENCSDKLWHKEVSSVESFPRLLGASQLPIPAAYKKKIDEEEDENIYRLFQLSDGHTISKLENSSSFPIFPKNGGIDDEMYKTLPPADRFVWDVLYELELAKASMEVKQETEETRDIFLQELEYAIEFQKFRIQRFKDETKGQVDKQTIMIKTHLLKELKDSEKRLDDYLESTEDYKKFKQLTDNDFIFKSLHGIKDHRCHKVEDLADFDRLKDSDEIAADVLREIIDQVDHNCSGGRPFERVEIETCDPVENTEFNSELFDFMSAGRADIPDATVIDWLHKIGYSNKKISNKCLPRDILQRLVGKKEHIEADDYEDWEYSVVHPKEEDEEEEKMNRILLEFAESYRESEDPDDDKITDVIPFDFLEDCAKKVKTGEIELNPELCFRVPMPINPFYLMSVRDPESGQLTSITTKVKNRELREREYHIRNQHDTWINEDRPAGPCLKGYGWNIDWGSDDEDDGDEEEGDDILIAKPKEKKKKLPFDVIEEEDYTDVKNKILKELMNDSFSQKIHDKSFKPSEVQPNESLLNIMKKLNLYNRIPEDLNSVDDLLESLELPTVSDINGERLYPVENESAEVEDWMMNWTKDTFERFEEIDRERLMLQIRQEEDKFSRKLQTEEPVSTLRDVLNLPKGEEGETKTDIESKSSVNIELIEQESNCLKEETAISKTVITIENMSEEDRERAKQESLQWTQGEAECEAKNEEFAKLWEQKHGTRDALQFTKLPSHFEEKLNINMSFGEYHKRYFTFPYFSSFTFQPNIILLRRILNEIPQVEEFAFASPNYMTMEEQESKLNTIIDKHQKLDGHLEDKAKCYIEDWTNHHKEPVNIDYNFPQMHPADVAYRESVEDEIKRLLSDIPEGCQDEDLDLVQAVQGDRFPDLQLPTKIKSVSLVVDPFEEEDFEKQSEIPTSEDITETEPEIDSYFDKYFTKIMENDECEENVYDNSDRENSEDDEPSKIWLSVIKDLETDEEINISDDEDDNNVKVAKHGTYRWRPLKQCDDYKGFDEIKLTTAALGLIESTNKTFDSNHDDTDMFSKWLNCEIDPSSKRFMKWIKHMKKKYPNTINGTYTPVKTRFTTIDEETVDCIDGHANNKQGLNPPKKQDEKDKLDQIEKLEEQEQECYVKQMQEKGRTVNKPEEQDLEERVEPDVDLGRVALNDNAIKLDERFRKKLIKEEWAEEVDTDNPVSMAALREPAMEFPFELDNFQKQAILALEKGFNVFVDAHTSAGKTVVAEYAIAMARRNRSRSVYTSPVKALSNQKFHDFKKKFQGKSSVGLITGDLQLNESAECLIMTTEILRSMLYNSSERIRDLEFVVFDEVHYLNDPERGHVWEESLILLPSNVQIVMLSATVPNKMEFANWIGRVKKRQVIVCSTQKRPVPLKHYLYIDSVKQDGKFLLKDADRSLSRIEYDKAKLLVEMHEQTERTAKNNFIKKLEEEDRKKKGIAKTGPRKPNAKYRMNETEFSNYRKHRDKSYWIRFIAYLEKNDLMPVVVFVFSRKTCDELATLLTSVDLTTKTEKHHIRKFIWIQIKKLDEIDQDLDQIRIMSEQLSRGIAVHHSGILPIMKEIVESLFHEGIVKVLFATETFAIGVNMPARTVVFNSIEKFDGCEKRLLKPAEYIQMAGRAGRRGKDKEGNVIIRCRPGSIVPFNDLESVMQGSPSELTSQFKLFYRMILNTLTTRGMIPVLTMMKSSYCENSQQLMLMKNKQTLDDLYDKAQKMQEQINGLMKDSQKDLYTNFYDAVNEYLIEWYQFKEDPAIKYHIGLEEGRFVRVSCGREINKNGVILEYIKSPNEVAMFKILYLVSHNKFYSTILPSDQNILKEFSEKELERWYKMLSMFPRYKNYQPDSPDSFGIMKVKASDIFEIFQKKISKDDVNALHNDVTLVLAKKALGQKKYSLGNLSIDVCTQLWQAKNLTPLKISVNDYETKQTLDRLQALRDKAIACATLAQPHEMEDMAQFELFFHWKETERERKDLKHLLLSMTNLELYQNKMEVLKQKKYIDEEQSTVLKKGYMAARVSKYELIVCELLTENILQDLSPEEVAALLSFLVHQNKSNQNSDLDQSEESIIQELTPDLANAVKKVKEIIDDIEQCEAMNNIDKNNGSEGFKLSFGLTNIIFNWAHQMSFKNILLLPEADSFQEGILVRLIQQLLETLKEVESAAKIMGDPSIPDKIHAAGQTIKRGIVFAPSLYTEESTSSTIDDEESDDE